MRAALSILGLVIVFAIVMISMKNQAQQLVASRAPTGASAASAGLPNPANVQRQVQQAEELAASQASAAMP